jgi:hypothetical protein
MILLIGTFLTFIALTPRISHALDVVEPQGKQWEYTVSTGYTDFTKDNISGAFDLWLRAQCRVIYPVLFGIGAEGTLANHIWWTGGNFPLTVRVGIRKVKFDFILSPGFAYVQNTDNGDNNSTGISKWVGSGTAGLEVKTFVKKGTSIGIGGYYSVYSDSRLNNFKINLVLGF